MNVSVPTPVVVILDVGISSLLNIPGNTLQLYPVVIFLTPDSLESCCELPYRFRHPLTLQDSFIPDFKSHLNSPSASGVYTSLRLFILDHLYTECATDIHLYLLNSCLCLSVV